MDRPPAHFIVLHNGPWHGQVVEDLGMVVIRMGIASQWENGMPAPGARSGFASYEPTPDRSLAFWLGNTWEGTTISNHPPGS